MQTIAYMIFVRRTESGKRTLAPTPNTAMASAFLNLESLVHIFAGTVGVKADFQLNDLDYVIYLLGLAHP